MPDFVECACKVDQAGVYSDGNVYIGIEACARVGENPAFPGYRQFFAAPSVRREMLATALACLAAGHTAWVRLQSAEPNSQIEIFAATPGLGGF